MRRPTEFFESSGHEGALVFSDSNVAKFHVRFGKSRRDALSIVMTKESALSLHDLLFKMLDQLKRERRRAGAKSAKPTRKAAAK